MSSITKQIKQMKRIVLGGVVLLGLPVQSNLRAEESMDKMWGDKSLQKQTGDASRGPNFRKGRYGMFIHWGLYSQLAGQWKGKTYYGIGEWIMNPSMAAIPVAEYMDVAKSFNPEGFDAKAIVKLAKDAGMSYLIITTKHHEGFAMFKSAHPFNIVDASPFGRDPMKELAEACREAGLGLGFYYSHNLDWTTPGGGGGPKEQADGSPATFEQYFWQKCYPQVKEICTQYGPLEVVWFDMPGDMPKELVVQLHDLVRATQPKALLGSRIGYGMGDYATLGDMEVPAEKVDGLWETCDTTNDSWAHAWYDNNWKEPREILHRLVSTVARGGNYLLNCGPDGKGQISEQSQKFLREAGLWIQANPKVIYGAGPSPWNSAMPWGDVTMEGDKTMNLVVFERPRDGMIYLPGLTTAVTSATSMRGTNPVSLVAESVPGGVRIKLPAQAAPLADVIRVELAAKPQVDPMIALHPNLPNNLLCLFAEPIGANKKKLAWMEKFGEWKHATQVGEWGQDGRAVWTVNVLEPGEYKVALRYRGKGRVAWKIAVDQGAAIQNQQAATEKYEEYPMGVLEIDKAGVHKIAVALVEGDREAASLESIELTRVESPVHPSPSPKTKAASR